MASGEPAAWRRPAVTSAIPSEELAGLVLAELRAYREELSAEEDKVSYWRRLVHARIDVIHAQAGSPDTLSFTDLVRVLGDTGSGRSRRALIRVSAAETLPDLPDLAELSVLWAAVVDPRDTGQVAHLVQRLDAQGLKLSEYRRALHERIDAATGELILRYRAHPQAALALLPQE